MKNIRLTRSIRKDCNVGKRSVDAAGAADNAQLTSPLHWGRVREGCAPNRQSMPQTMDEPETDWSPLALKGRGSPRDGGRDNFVLDDVDKNLAAVEGCDDAGDETPPVVALVVAAVGGVDVVVADEIQGNKNPTRVSPLRSNCKVQSEAEPEK